MKKISLFVLLFVLVVIGVGYMLFFKDDPVKLEQELVIENFIGKNILDFDDYIESNNIKVRKEYQYSTTVEKDLIISQEYDGAVVDAVISLGFDTSLYGEYGVNELGKIPIMMYHGIVDVTETSYIGGNVDKSGYNRTADAFRDDLEFYYQSGYRMVRLSDYVDGNITTELGFSPIVLTFDDGRVDNFRVLGKNENGDLIIDPNSAVGILEEFKTKYPDYNITATFFLNKGLFNQPEYNEDIIKWLVANDYDIGNHTMNHVDFTNVDKDEAQEEVVKLYSTIEKVIPNEYVNIIALPYGSPYNINHDNFKYIVDATYDGVNYKTKTTLRVGWEPELSCFDKKFNPLFIKRVRAYDNNGVEFDIEMVFTGLEKNRYISDGNSKKIVVPSGFSELVNNYGDKTIIEY